jgi:hypothetical protein
MVNILTPQKVVKKSILNPNISNIQIDGRNCFEIKIETRDSDEIAVEATIDGEYQKYLILKIIEAGATLLVSCDFEQDFKNPNDKLSAHKVVSIALHIKLPKQKKVNVFGNSCNITTGGKYEKLKVTLDDGACWFNDVNGAIEAITQSGNIIVESRAADILAVSKYGTVKKQSLPQGKNQFVLQTVTGNIQVNRIE